MASNRRRHANGLGIAADAEVGMSRAPVSQMVASVRAEPNPSLPPTPGLDGFRPIVIVLGMNRSGMALCSHVLSALGIDIAGDDVDDDHRNPWERREIARFHDQVMTLFHCPASRLFFDLQLPPAWWAEPCLRALRREMTSVLRATLAVDQPFGFTEPRAAPMLPLWRQICRALSLAPLLVLCLRNPAQISRALAARHDYLDPDLIEYHWFAYMVEVFRQAHDHPLCLVQFEDWFENPEKNLAKINDFLRANRLHAEPAFDGAIAQIIDPRRRHEPVPGLEPRQPLIRSLYKLTREYADDLGGREQIGLVVDNFTTFQQLQWPLQREFQRAHHALVAAERELVTLRDELEQADAQTAETDAAWRARAAENDAAWRAQAAETDVAWRALYAEAERQASAHADKADALASETAALRAALLDAERRLVEQAASAQVAAQKIAQLRKALAESQREAVEQAAGAECATSVVAALRADLGTTENQRVEPAGSPKTLPPKLSDRPSP
jgi:hypothetical protein